MKAVSSSSWKARKPGQDQSSLTTYISPAFTPNQNSKPLSAFKSFQNVFLNRNSSAHSLPSSSGSTISSVTLSDSVHPYSSSLMLPAPLPVVSSHDVLEEEDECPVCLEPLSFSFRLPGEKPHIVPECGHALHEVCLFTSIARISFKISLRHALVQSMVPLRIKPDHPFPENLTWAFVASADGP